MNPVLKLLIRAAGSFVLAYVIAWSFWRLTDWIWVVLLALFLLAMSYLAEGMRRRREDGSD